MVPSTISGTSDKGRWRVAMAHTQTAYTARWTYTIIDAWAAWNDVPYLRGDGARGELASE